MASHTKQRGKPKAKMHVDMVGSHGSSHKLDVMDSASPPAVTHISMVEKRNMALLILLYAIQGVPLGLTLGAMPFILQAKLSFTQIGIFSMAAYPYSFKLLWSPIVDSVYIASVGRRKSWIIPIQLISAALMLTSADWMSDRLNVGDVKGLTILFFFYVLLAATQDIAVDGWALTLLSEANVGYASTCQTLGMNIGFFTSFTVLLSLNNPEFCSKYLRQGGSAAGWLGEFAFPASDLGVVSLPGFVRFWGWFFVAATALVALVPELDQPESADSLPSSARAMTADSRTDTNAGAGSPARWSEVAESYRQLLRVMRLPAMWQLTLLLVTYRVGVLAAEQAAVLKLLDKGVGKESLAALALVQFPVDLASALVAGRWAARASPHVPFLVGYAVRLAMAAASTVLVAAYPQGGGEDATQIFTVIVVAGLVTSFTSTLMFTALGSFYNRISDPAMGGAYLTLLNTIANMGVTLPKTPLFYLMDALTDVQCLPVGGLDGGPLPAVCPKKTGTGATECVAVGGKCVTLADGFYTVTSVSIVFGAILGVYYMRLFPRLMRLPLESWRAAGGSGATDVDKES